MATIPADEKVFMVSNSTNTIYSGSAALKAMSEWYTMQDVIDSVPRGFHMPLAKSSSPGVTYTVALAGNVSASSQQVANLMVLSPFIPANDLTVSSLSIVVTGTLIPGSLAKILVYANVNSRPNGLLIESTDLDCSTSGRKIYNTTFTFKAGTIYWIGTHANSNQRLTSLITANLIAIGTNDVAGAYLTALTGTVYLYTDPIPTNPTSLNLVTSSVNAVMMQ